MEGRRPGKEQMAPEQEEAERRTHELIDQLAREDAVEEERQAPEMPVNVDDYIDIDFNLQDAKRFLVRSMTWIRVTLVTLLDGRLGLTLTSKVNYYLLFNLIYFILILNNLLDG